MTRNELLISLGQTLRTEEAIVLYSKHMKNTLYLSGLGKNLQGRVKETLETLYKESNQHRIFMNQLIDEVKKGGQDVY